MTAKEHPEAIRELKGTQNMNDEEPVNAKIAGTILGIERGILTFMIDLEWSWGGQGLGGYALDGWNLATNSRNIGHGPGIIAIRRILETVGVEAWEDLPGTLVRAKIGELGTGDPPIIGHIIDDKWFDLQEFMRENIKP